jgi:hypothetical protein
MTLLVNEIHIQENLQHSFIILAADRRITTQGKFHSNRRKLFEIEYLNGGVGYFGLAQLNEKEFFSGWFPNFINKQVGIVKSLGEFANNLSQELNIKVDKSFLKNNPSGFQVCGYNDENKPELWFVRNILSMDGPYYKGFATSYRVSEDFLTRDAQAMGYGSIRTAVQRDWIQYYINGDIRVFHAIWLKLDEFLSEMLTQPGFKKPQQLEDLVNTTLWKMKVIAGFYKQFAKELTIVF